MIQAKPGEKYINLQREEYLTVKRKVMKLSRKFRPQ